MRYYRFPKNSRAPHGYRGAHEGGNREVKSARESAEPSNVYYGANYGAAGSKKATIVVAGLLLLGAYARAAFGADGATTPERQDAPFNPFMRAEQAVVERIKNHEPVAWAAANLAIVDAEVCVHNPVVERVDGESYWLQIGRADVANPLAVAALAGGVLDPSVPVVSGGPAEWNGTIASYMVAAPASQHAIPVGMGSPAVSGQCA